MPRRPERPLARVVDLLGEHVEVELVRSVDEGALGQRWSSALDAELARTRRGARRGRAGRWRGTRPSRRGRSAGYPENTGGMPGSWISSGLQETIRAQAMAARMNRGEADDVVLDDERGLQLVEDLPQAVVDVGGPVAEGTERRFDERLELLDRRRPEDGRGLADEVLPELTRAPPAPRAPDRAASAAPRSPAPRGCPRTIPRRRTRPDARARAEPGRSRRSCSSGRRPPRERRQWWRSGSRAVWLRRSLRYCPRPAISGGRAWGAKLRDPHGEVKAPSPRQELSCRLSVPSSRALGGTTGRAASSSPSGSSTGLDVPDADGGLLAILADRVRGRQRGRIRDPGDGRRRREPSKPPNRPTRSGPRLRGWRRTAARSRESTAIVVGDAGEPARRRCCLARLPTSRGGPVEHLGRRRRPSWCSSSTGGCGRGPIPSRSCSQG